jgi:hypothetical protein
VQIREIRGRETMNRKILKPRMARMNTDEKIESRGAPSVQIREIRGRETMNRKILKPRMNTDRKMERHPYQSVKSVVK